MKCLGLSLALLCAVSLYSMEDASGNHHETEKRDYGLVTSIWDSKGNLVMIRTVYTDGSLCIQDLVQGKSRFFSSAEKGPGGLMTTKDDPSVGSTIPQHGSVVYLGGHNSGA